MTYLREHLQLHTAIAPELHIHFSPLGTHDALWADTAPAALPAMLQIHAITIDLRCQISDEAQDLCNEPVWTRFAAAALKLSHLKIVELFREWDPEGLYPVREPAFVGITDAAFRPLIEAGKFICRFAPLFGDVMYEKKDTVNPKLPENLRRGLTDGGGEDDDGDGGSCEARNQAAVGVHRKFCVLS